MDPYNFKKIEEKWQKIWEQKRIFEVKDKPKKKFFCLEMFPYPSSPAIHMGHVRNYTIGDCYARFKRMQQYDVLYPMGFDAFGLPAENYAIKNGIHPEKSTFDNIKGIKKQLKRMGFSYDWSREVITCTPEYYKWNQWIFLKMYEKDLAYKKEAEVNWCPSCKTVLANEQVIEGKCWRDKSEVEPKLLKQWFLKITAYADELLSDLKNVEWPERVKVMQENWIGKSAGVEIDFLVKDTKEALPVFTTRPDTIFGVTFLVMAPEHPRVLELVKGTKQEKEVKAFIEKVKKESLKERATTKEKEGLFIGKYVINPLNNEEVPIYIANFVVLEYGTGTIMAVPAHDKRDFEFAKKYKIKIKPVIKKEHTTTFTIDEPFIGEGILVDSSHFSGLHSRAAITKIIDHLEAKELGRRTTHFKLRDWLISRQRYWGTPIPVIYCDHCGILPVLEKDLPITLPKNVKFTGKGNPLESVASFVKTTCHKCKGPARRETDTMDTFFDSSWYYLRYADPKNKKIPFDKTAADIWLPVDQYIGGIEHAILHLLYARFFTKVFRDMKMISCDEPFRKLLSQGMVTLGGEAMSKSKGNVVDPMEVIKEYGADTLRLFILSVASPEKELEWSEKGMQGSYRLLNKLYALGETCNSKNDEKDDQAVSKMHGLIKSTTHAIENFELPKTAAKIADGINFIHKQRENISKKVYTMFLTNLTKVIAPFTPHLAEELWSFLGHKNSIAKETWPSYDEGKINPIYDQREDYISDTLADIRNILALIKIKPTKVTLFITEAWKYALFQKLSQEKDCDFKSLIKKYMDKKHGEEIAKILNSFIKGNFKQTAFSSQDEELKELEKNKDYLANELKLTIALVRAEDASEPKAKNATPSKPALLVQ